MIARLTYFSFVPGKLDELKKIYNEEIAPKVRKQKGNIECRLLEPEDKKDDYISLTIWDNEEDAGKYHSSGVYKQLVDKVRASFSKEPVLKIYHTESVMETV